jgi:hypothetical protein
MLTMAFSAGRLAEDAMVPSTRAGQKASGMAAERGVRRGQQVGIAGSCRSAGHLASGPGATPARAGAENSRSKAWR